MVEESGGRLQIAPKGRLQVRLTPRQERLQRPEQRVARTGKEPVHASGELSGDGRLEHRRRRLAADAGGRRAPVRLARGPEQAQERRVAVAAGARRARMDADAEERETAVAPALAV